MRCRVAGEGLEVEPESGDDEEHRHQESESDGFEFGFDGLAVAGVASSRTNLTTRPRRRHPAACRARVRD